MNVGILGSGAVAQALAKGFLGNGDAVRFGTRDPGKLKDFVAANPKASAGSFADAAAFGELIVLATKWDGTENAIKLAGAKHFKDKVVMDVTNPLDFSKGPPPRIAATPAGSAGAQVQRWLDGAKVVKAFNIVGNAFMVHPQLPGGPPDMLMCGDDPGAKQQIANVCKAFGWPVADIGGIEASAYLEGLAMVWILYGFKTNTWSHAFKLLRK